jgi:hypothetical protein
MKNRQPSLMVHTNPEFENFEFDQHLGSHKHVINIIMWFRDMGCYNNSLVGFQNNYCLYIFKFIDKKLE